nr:BTB/POZ domain-containing protein At3g44820 [Ipomoea batatas]
MAPAGKVTSFYRQGNDWFCNASLPSDISLIVDGVNFHLHKFPLISKCGRIFKALEEAQGSISRGLGRWQSGQIVTSRTVASFSMTPATVDQKDLLESIVKLLPTKKGKSFCRFLLGLLRVALILGINHSCQETLERRIGMQLNLATLDSLLIPSYSDSDTLYNTDCVERMIHHFISEPATTMVSPSSFDLGTSPSSEPLCRVAKLMDSYIAEIASDVNLKPERIHALAEALPDSSRSLHDGLYRAVDIYFKVLRVDLERMRSRVRELEEEFSKDQARDEKGVENHTVTSALSPLPCPEDGVQTAPPIF